MPRALLQVLVPVENVHPGKNRPLIEKRSAAFLSAGSNAFFRVAQIDLDDSGQYKG